MIDFLDSADPTSGRWLQLNRWDDHNLWTVWSLDHDNQVGKPKRLDHFIGIKPSSLVGRSSRSAISIHPTVQRTVFLVKSQIYFQISICQSTLLNTVFKPSFISGACSVDSGDRPQAYRELLTRSSSVRRMSRRWRSADYRHGLRHRWCLVVICVD